MKRLITVIITLIFFAHCSSDSVPDKVIKRDEMIALLTDVHVADGYINSIPVDSATKISPVLYSSILAKHHTDSVQFAKSLNWYTLHPHLLQDLYKTVSANLDTLQKIEERRRAAEERMKAKKVAEQEKKRAKQVRDSINLEKKRLINKKKDSILRVMKKRIDTAKTRKIKP